MHNPTGAHAGNPDALLSRELGTRQLAANIFNYTVGSGIFVLPAFAVLQLGTAPRRWPMWPAPSSLAWS